MTSPDRDILISRVVDGTALEHDWAALEALGNRDPSLWRELAQSQRQHAGLVSAVTAATRVAEQTELVIPETHVVGRLSTFARWGGWAAAAAVAVAWLGGQQPSATQGPTAGFSGASPVPAITTPAEALNEYLRLGARDGNVLGEMPAKVVLQTIPASDGSARYDVYYLRQIVERATVDDLYRVSSDETGRSVAPVPTRPRVRPASNSY